MNADIAPKYLYYLSFSIGAGLWIFVSVVHATVSVNSVVQQHDLTLFLITTVIWGIVSGYLFFHVNYVRYIVMIPEKKSEFIYGNIMFRRRGSVERLFLVKRVWWDVFKVKIEGKTHYLVTHPQLIEEYFNT